MSLRNGCGDRGDRRVSVHLQVTLFYVPKRAVIVKELQVKRNMRIW